MKGHNVIMHYAMPIMQYCGYMVSYRGSAMIPSDRAVATDYRLSIVTMFIFSTLAAILNEMFNAISGRISEMVRDMA